MPYKTAIDCIEELATQCFLSKLTDDDVSTFRRVCSKENDIIKLAQDKSFSDRDVNSEKAG